MRSRGHCAEAFGLEVHPLFVYEHDWVAVDVRAML
jgi:hypothetical protein